MSTITVKELAAPTGFDLKIAAGETLDLKSQGTVTMPTGSTLAVYEDTHATEATFQSTSWANVGLTITLTPKSKNSKFFCTWSLEGKFEGGNSGLGTRIIRTIGSSETVVYTSATGYDLYTADTSAALRMRAQYNTLDTPNTASSINYKVQIKNQASGSAGAVSLNNASDPTSLHIWEVQG